MLRRFSPDHIARLCALHPWRVIVAWLVALALTGPLAAGVSDLLDTDWSFTSRPESVRGQELLEQRLLGGPEPATEVVVVASDTLTVDDPGFQLVVEETTARLAGLDGVVASASNLYEAEALGSPEASALVSADRHATIIPVVLAGSFNDAQGNATTYLSAVRSSDSEDVRVIPVGNISIGEEYTHLSESDLIRGELFAIPCAMLILLIVFRAAVAASIPLVLAVVTIVVALGVTSIIARYWELSVFVSNMITMISLAVGIDYALFIVERYREERRGGAAKLDAIQLAGQTASRAVLFSGITVVLALVGLLFIPTTIFRSLGLGAILAVVIAVIVVLTLVPAILSLLGDRIDRLGLPALRRSGRGSGRSVWAAIAATVMRRPVVATAASAGVLILLTLPFLDLKRSQTGVETFPESDVRTGYEILARDFSAGLFSPVHVIVNAPRTPDVEAAIGRFSAAVAADPRVAQVAAPQWNDAGDLADISVPLRFGPEEPASYEVVHWLRDDAIPSTFDGTPGEVLVTGLSAKNTDFVAGIDAWTPAVFVFVLGFSFVLLLVAFRSIVIPIKAIVMNLLSVGAAYGLLVLVFQKGYGADLLGFQQMPAIESWIPIFLFCVLFGLSMDYHVFLLTRVQERFRETRQNRESVTSGLEATGRIITGAAVIMVLVFGGFAMGEMVMFQQMGFGLAVAILLDATLVRSILVPASMALLGSHNWYLPGWLQWLPDLRVEGGSATRSDEVAGLGTVATTADGG